MSQAIDIPQVINLLDKFPDRVPVIIATLPPLPQPKRTKLLLPKSFTVGQTMLRIRKAIAASSPERGLFIMVNNLLPPSSKTLGELYAEHRSEDYTLQLTVREESVFGYA